MSMLENLAFIKEHGEELFLRQQQEKYVCPDCGNLHTVHYDYCVYCKQNKRDKNIQKTWAGFNIIRKFGSFNEEVFTDNSEKQIYVLSLQ